MRTLIYLVMVISFTFSITASFAFDVNGDGVEGLEEAIHALQVVSGLNPYTPDAGDATVSDVLAGKTFSNSDATGLTGERPPAPVASYTGGSTTAAVDWPEPRFTDGTNVVIDHLTGIMWQKYRFNERMLSADAANYCANLVIFEPVGAFHKIYIDWILPSKNALLSLVDNNQHNPALPPDHPFEGFYGEYLWFWSFTPVAGDIAHMWLVDYFYGELLKGADVRGRPSPYVR